MKQEKTFRSQAFEAIHSAAEGLHRAGAISLETLRSFDESCLAPVEMLQPQEIKAVTFKPTGFCPLSEYQRVDHTEMGDGGETAGRRVA